MSLEQFDFVFCAESYGLEEAEELLEVLGIKITGAEEDRAIYRI
jgi:hypothetical protein